MYLHHSSNHLERFSELVFTNVKKGMDVRNDKDGFGGRGQKLIVLTEPTSMIATAGPSTWRKAKP